MRFGNVSPKLYVPDSKTSGPPSSPGAMVPGLPGPRPSGAFQYVTFSTQFSMQNVPLVPATSQLHQPPRP